jgi:hypothetical protein
LIASTNLSSSKTKKYGALAAFSATGAFGSAHKVATTFFI